MNLSLIQNYARDTALVSKFGRINIEFIMVSYFKIFTSNIFGNEATSWITQLTCSYNSMQI